MILFEKILYTIEENNPVIQSAWRKAMKPNKVLK